MKSIFLFFTQMILINSFINGQTSGKIKPFAKAPKAGIINNYAYTPPAGFKINEDFRVLITYKSKDFICREISLKKNGANYLFSFAVPDSVSVVILAICDSEKTIIDNNENKGYIIELFNSNNKKFKSREFSKTQLLDGFSTYFLKIQISDLELKNMYELNFSMNPNLKRGRDYLNYLSVLYKVEQDKAIYFFKKFIKDSEFYFQTESNLMLSVEICNFLGLTEKLKELEDKILLLYPKGEFVKKKFWRDYYKENERTEEYILKKKTEFINIFKSIDESSSDSFYYDLISLFADKNEILEITDIQKRIHNKRQLANIYNDISSNIINNDSSITTPLQVITAKFLSCKSLSIIKNELYANINYDYENVLKEKLKKYTHTYAYILYKEGKIDSAYYYQNKLIANGASELKVKEHFALYAQPIKGVHFVKNFIEKELSKGVVSQHLTKQLKEIYTTLGLDYEEFLSTVKKAELLEREKKRQIIYKKFQGDLDPELDLEDIKGQNIKLSQLKNKVIVLDFWATWCLPCLASFPKMTELINSFKNDSNVVFYFINTWEKLPFSKVSENVKNLLAKEKYDFNVLFDKEERVVKNYKIDGIPTIVILNKKHEVVFMGDYSNKIASEIVSAKD